MQFQVDLDDDGLMNSTLFATDDGNTHPILYKESLAQSSHSLNITVLETQDPNAEFVFNFVTVGNIYPISR